MWSIMPAVLQKRWQYGKLSNEKIQNRFASREEHRKEQYDSKHSRVLVCVFVIEKIFFFINKIDILLSLSAAPSFEGSHP